MTKKEFETTDKPLCMIVSLDPSTGKVLFDTYDWPIQDEWLEDIEKDFPKMMHFSTLNPAAIQVCLCSIHKHKPTRQCF